MPHAARTAGGALPLQIKRYASRRLYNTESSDYVTLDDIARVISGGREVQIVDLKTGDDLTRQYLLQIIAEHESGSDSLLPLEVLTELVRSYADRAQAVVPQFLAASFRILREGVVAEETPAQVAPAPVEAPSAEAEAAALQRRQQAFLETLLTGWGRTPEADRPPEEREPVSLRAREELDEIKKQLAELQSKLASL